MSARGAGGADSVEPRVRWFEDLDRAALGAVGGKNAALGEMIRTLGEKGVRVPGGFATTATAYREFLEDNDLEGVLADRLRSLERDETPLARVGETIRRAFEAADLPEALAREIVAAYRELGRRAGVENVDVAVRSSATAEDLPEASFAGQQETFLNVSGERELLGAVRSCLASLFTDRAIAYREEKGFDHLEVALSVGVQRMVRADEGASGVMFTLDTETGFPDVVVINAAWGLGENVVQGTVTPDEFRVFKPLLDGPGLCPILDRTLGDKRLKMIYAGGGRRTRNVPTTAAERRAFTLADDQVLQLARWARDIEDHYERPMDIEWALDGRSGELWILQARPETVRSRESAAAFHTYELRDPPRPLVEGLAIGSAIAAGQAFVLDSVAGADRFEDGGVLVTGMTDPDWVPIMRRAAGIVTDRGGRTSHAAIISRELGLPAVIGTGDGTARIADGDVVTVDCSAGERGLVHQGRLQFEVTEVDLDNVPATRTRILMNLASPDAAMRWWRLPCDGVGLARMEFVIGNTIQVHPMALVHYEEIEDPDVRRRIDELTAGYADREEYFVDHLSRALARIAASRHPDPVLVRLSDFKTNEYARLVGGRQFEPDEENPMLGFRGACRYYSDRYRDGFALECRAIRRVRERIGLDNVVVMVPFCRTVGEADRVLEALAEQGLRRGDAGLEVWVMAEIPNNILQAEEFAARFDGFSIGSNDLTQLVLGVDRDSRELAPLFDERDEGVRRIIRSLIDAAHGAGRPVGICGQAPSDYPEFAAFLVEAGIDSISLNPDRVIATRRLVDEQERAGGV